MPRIANWRLRFTSTFIFFPILLDAPLAINESIFSVRKSPFAYHVPVANFPSFLSGLIAYSKVCSVAWTLELSSTLPLSFHALAKASSAYHNIIHINANSFISIQKLPFNCSSIWSAISAQCSNVIWSNILYFD